MKHSRECALGALLLVTAALPAQGAVPPPSLAPITRPAGLNAGKVPCTDVIQVQTVRLPSDPLGTLTAALTVSGLSASWGGRGGYDLILGSYDALADTFMPSAQAAACNSSGSEFGAMLDASGLNLVFEKDVAGTPTIMLCTRSSTAAPFGAPRAITGIGALRYFDPAIGTVAGQTFLFYVNGSEIVQTSLDLASASVLGPAIVVARSVMPAWTANSPSPIFDARGEVAGLLHHEENGTVDDWMIAHDLDPATASHELLRSATWKNNGGSVGGRLLSAESSPAPYHVIARDSYLLLAARAGNGEIATLESRLPPGAASAGMSSVLAIGGGFLASGVPLPGFTGQLGLDPALLFITLPIGAHAAVSGSASTTLPIPGDPSLVGARLATQAVGFGQGKALLSNTSELAIRRAAAPSIQLRIPYDGQAHLLPIPIDPATPQLLFRSAPTNAERIPLVAQALSGVDLDVGVQATPGRATMLSVANATMIWARMPYVPLAQDALLDVCPQDPNGFTPVIANLENCKINGGWQIVGTDGGTKDQHWCIVLDAKRWDAKNNKFVDSTCPVDFEIRSGGFDMDKKKYTHDPAIGPLGSGALPPGKVATICTQGAGTPKHKLVFLFRCLATAANGECIVTVQFKKVDKCEDCKSP